VLPERRPADGDGAGPQCPVSSTAWSIGIQGRANGAEGASIGVRGVTLGLGDGDARFVRWRPRSTDAAGEMDLDEMDAADVEATNEARRTWEEGTMWLVPLSSSLFSGRERDKLLHAGETLRRVD
jgi:hypothetical protein